MNETDQSILLTVGKSKLYIPVSKVVLDNNKLLSLSNNNEIDMIETCKSLDISYYNLFRYTHLLVEYIILDIKRFGVDLTPEQNNLLKNLKIFELNEFHKLSDFLGLKELSKILEFKTINMINSLEDHEREYAIKRLSDNSTAINISEFEK